MDSCEYVTCSTEVSLGSLSDSRDLSWTSIEDFTLFIRSISPYGEITSISGEGYTVYDGDEVPPLKLIVLTKRLRVDIEREEAEQLVIKQREAELAAQEAARQVLKAHSASLQENIEQLEVDLSETILALTALHDEHTNYHKEEHHDDH